MKFVLILTMLIGPFVRAQTCSSIFSRAVTKQFRLEKYVLEKNFGKVREVKSSSLISPDRTDDAISEVFWSLGNFEYYQKNQIRYFAKSVTSRDLNARFTRSFIFSKKISMVIAAHGEYLSLVPVVLVTKVNGIINAQIYLVFNDYQTQTEANFSLFNLQSRLSDAVGSIAAGHLTKIGRTGTAFYLKYQNITSKELHLICQAILKVLPQEYMVPVTARARHRRDRQ